MSSQPSTVDTDRGLTPVVGAIIIMGLVLVLGIGLLYFGGNILTGEEDPRVNAHFTVNATNASHIEVTYTQGKPFTAQDTTRLYVVGTNSSGDKISPVSLYNGSAVNETGGAKLRPGTTVISAVRVNDTAIDPGSSLQVVWVPEERPQTKLVLDELSIPDVEYLRVASDQEGSIYGELNVTTGGDDPRD